MKDVALLSLALAFAAAGCRGGDPTPPRLAPGVEAVLCRDPAREPGRFEDASKAVLFEPGASNHVEFAPLGTRVRVVDDSYRVGRPDRLVAVLVLEGDHAGRAWAVRRDQLAPVAPR